MDLQGKHVLVVGAGRTGLAVARFLGERGARVRLTDRAKNDPFEKRLSLDVGKVEWRPGEEGEALLEGIDFVVPSPGVPRLSVLLKAAVALGITILAEIELAFRFVAAPLYAITGTNGKSTTTELLGAMLRHAGQSVFVGGNLGTPLIEAADQPVDCAVAEISSFQLEWVDSFRPAIGIFLNLTEDHLDRYDSLDEYGEAKMALFRRQTASDWAVLSREDPWLWARRDRLQARVASFGLRPVDVGAWSEANAIVVRMPDGTEHRIDLGRTQLTGVHNLENMMAAATAALLAGAPVEAVQRAIDTFPGLPHRLQTVRVRDGVRWIDDSKGTNVGAVVKSLESVASPVILLLGGVSKGGSYDPLRTLVRERVKCVVVYGQAAGEIERALAGESRTVSAGSFEEAVRMAAEVANPGDTVLLSPACASFDLFRDYAERGERFRALVEAL